MSKFKHRRWTKADQVFEQVRSTFDQVWSTLISHNRKEMFSVLDGTFRQNIYLLERKNFALKQIFALLRVVANYLNE